MSTIENGPYFVRYFGPVLRALEKLGGSGRPSEVKDEVAKEMNLPDTILEQTISSGTSKFGKDIEWARFYLARAGWIDASRRGVWTISEGGQKQRDLTHQEALRTYHRVRQVNGWDDSEVVEQEESIHLPPQEIIVEDKPQLAISPPSEDYRAELLATILTLSPSGFEMLCQRLLRESGFERVDVTGRTGDGGIDGIGVLQVTPFVSFRVLFQCKRYSGSVTSPQVRDFRGAMAGRADKGIILTTGTFTRDAVEEANREGVPSYRNGGWRKVDRTFRAIGIGIS